MLSGRKSFNLEAQGAFELELAVERNRMGNRRKKRIGEGARIIMVNNKAFRLGASTGRVKGPAIFSNGVPHREKE